MCIYCRTLFFLLHVHFAIFFYNPEMLIFCTDKFLVIRHFGIRVQIISQFYSDRQNWMHGKCSCFRVVGSLSWYGQVLRKDDDEWVKKCMEHEVEGSRPRGRPKKTWKDVVREDCQERKLNKEDAMDRCKWRKVIKEAR